MVNLLKKIFYLVCVLLFFIGCGKNPLSAPGTLRCQVTGSNSSSSSAPFLNFATVFLASGNVSNISRKYTVTIEKIEISTDGKEWIPLLKSNTEITAEWPTTNGQWVSGFTTVTPEYIINGMPVSSGTYPYFRIWFGPKIKVRSVNQDSSVEEKERDNFNKEFYPIVFSANERDYSKRLSAIGDTGKQGDAIRVERDKTIGVELRFYHDDRICKAILGNDTMWDEFLNSVSADVTNYRQLFKVVWNYY